MARKTKTISAANRLKRLARQYSLAWEDVSWLGGSSPEDWDEIRQRYRDARRKLHDAIDELCPTYGGQG